MFRRGGARPRETTFRSLDVLETVETTTPDKERDGEGNRKIENHFDRQCSTVSGVEEKILKRDMLEI